MKMMFSAARERSLVPLEYDLQSCTSVPAD
jgi:hypothetical protein